MAAGALFLAVVGVGGNIEGVVGDLPRRRVVMWNGVDGWDLGDISALKSGLIVRGKSKIRCEGR